MSENSGGSRDHRRVRREYATSGLARASLATDPLRQFDAWLGAARRSEVLDPTAMALATVAADARPHARIVLLKHYDEAGFVWYTDYESAKGQDLASNANAELLFYWDVLNRQVRIEGSVVKIDEAASDAYFKSRPLESRASAAASRQSQPIKSRVDLERLATQVTGANPNGDIPRPERWGGYRLSPTRFEFWQGREGRLHDRFVYRVAEVGAGWEIERLQP